MTKGYNNIIKIASSDTKSSVIIFCGIEGTNNNDKIDFSEVLIDVNDNIGRKMLK